VGHVRKAYGTPSTDQWKGKRTTKEGSIAPTVEKGKKGGTLPWKKNELGRTRHARGIKEKKLNKKYGKFIILNLEEKGQPKKPGKTRHPRKKQTTEWMRNDKGGVGGE